MAGLANDKKAPSDRPSNATPGIANALTNRRLFIVAPRYVKRFVCCGKRARHAAVAVLYVLTNDFYMWQIVWDDMSPALKSNQVPRLMQLAFAKISVCW